MSDKNDQVTALGLSRLLDQFGDSTNLRALASSFLNQVQAFEDAAHPLLLERDIDQMTGDRLDGLGRVVLQFRSGLDDDGYRQQLKGELAVLRSQGTAEEILTIAQLLVEMATADYEAREYYPKGFYVRPVDHILLQDAAVIGAKLRRAVSATTDMLFVYSLYDDDDTFRLSSQGATVETSTSLGLSTEIGGGPWDFDTTTLPGASLGRMRLNNADPFAATVAYIHQTDDDSTDQATFLTGLAGETLQVCGAADQAFLYDVTTSVDSGIYFTVTLESPRGHGPQPTNGAIVNIYSTATGGRLAGAA